MWVMLAVMSAVLLGFYDVFKKESLRGNAVIPVLLVNCVVCSLFFLPLIVGSAAGLIPEGSGLYVPSGGWEVHKWVLLKAVIVLSSWICGYFAMKHLPLTIVGPVNATRPVMTLVGALLIFGERLNLLQWCGVLVAIASFWMLGRSVKKEGIDFRHDRWVPLLIAAAVLGAVSGLYDKFLMSPEGGLGLNRFFVQGWYNLYQSLIMAAILLLVWLPERGSSTPFRWKWAIPMISVCLTGADLVYLYALGFPEAMIAVVSMIRRSSVLVSFVFGAILFKERNLRSKAIDLALVLASLVLLLLGSL